jgi:hypothetical protein
MPDKKISQLTAGGASQATDEYVIARSGDNFKVTGANVAAAATSVGTLTGLTVSGNATFDTSTLFVDAANNRVGMGIASSLASVLHIKGPAGSNPNTGGIVFQYSTSLSNFGAIGLDNSSGSFAVLAGSGASLRFHTNSDLATTNERWRMDASGHFLAATDNSFDIGASGANRPRNVFVAGNVTAGGNISIPSGNVLYLSGLSGGEYLQVSGGSLFLGTAGVGHFQINSSGNVGIGVAPSAWSSSYRAIQMIGGGLAAMSGTGDGYLVNNLIYDGAWKYINTGGASFYRQVSGSHAWFSALSGTGGTTATTTQAMTLDASGNLGIGTASQSSRLAVVTSGTPPTPPSQTIAQFYRSGDAFIDVTSANGFVSGVRFGDNTDGIYARISLNRTTNALSFLNANVERWQINSAGHFLAGVDNSYDIGASGATRPRTVYVATSVEGGYIRAGAASAGAASTTTIGNGTATTVGAAGAASALPANPLGYIIAHVGTTQVKIPYYTA